MEVLRWAATTLLRAGIERLPGGGSPAGDAAFPVSFRLNGRPVEIFPHPGESLLDALRNRLGIRSTKNGCAPQGQCGCCLALVDGLPKTACAVPVEIVAGKDVLTLEGIPEEERRLIAHCFVTAAGMQCGFCIPGIALRAKHLVDRNPAPTRAEIAKALDGHLC
ncbi:MAG: selenium-dependent molybdenum hydroxylase 1, partial [bacterium]